MIITPIVCCRRRRRRRRRRRSCLSSLVLHVDEDSNSAETSDESKPKRQRSAGKRLRSTMDQQ